MRRVLEWAGADGCTPEEVIDRSLELFDPQLLTSERRTELVRFVATDAQSSTETSALLRKVLSLIAASPEFQFN